ERPATATYAWTPARAARDVASSDTIIWQTVMSVRDERPSRLIVVVDGGAAMKSTGPVLGQLLKTVPRGLPIAIEVAGDDVVDLLGGVVPAGDPATAPASLAARLSAIDFAGGADSLPALVAAWDLAAAAPGSAVLWIHGPQSMLVAPTDDLRQRMERRKDAPTIYTYAAIGGENRLLASLADLRNFRAVPRYLPGSADLQRFLTDRIGGWDRFGAYRFPMPARRLKQLHGVAASRHLARRC